MCFIRLFQWFNVIHITKTLINAFVSHIDFSSFLTYFEKEMGQKQKTLSK